MIVLAWVVGLALVPWVWVAVRASQRAEAAGLYDTDDDVEDEDD